MQEYDYIAIGSGVGLAFVSKAINKGFTCAIIEKGKLGGTCLTRGCIPSKILIQPADIIRTVEHAKKIGLQYEAPLLDFDLLKKRMWDRINYSYTMESSYRQKKGLDIYKGVGTFVDNHKVKITLNDGGEIEIFGKNVILACGARSFIPPIKGLAETSYITYETFYGDKFPDKPWKSIVIVGGGVIGAEFAHMFSAFGTKVTIVEMQDRLLTAEDQDVSSHLLNSFRSNGIDVYLNHMAVEVTRVEKGKRVKIIDRNNDYQTFIECDEILIAAGVQSNADLANVENTDLVLTTKKWVRTNEYMETNVNHIWAIGDVTGKYLFRHKANYEMFKLAGNILNINQAKKPVDYSFVPWAVFTFPEIAHVGMTEEEAFEKYEKLLIGMLHYSDVAKGYAMGFDSQDQDDGFVKLILSPDYRIIGAHIVGPYADMLIQPYVVLMSTGCVCNLEGFNDNIDLIELKDHEYLFNPLEDTMVVHPSLGEIAGWAYRTLKWVERSEKSR